VLGVLPGILATVQATGAVKLLAGLSEPLLGRLLMVDALTMRFDEFKVTRRSDCAVCEDQPTIHVPRESAAPTCSADQRGRVQHLRPADLRRLLARGHVRVIDVREPAEFATACLPESRNVPFGRLLRDLPALLDAARARGGEIVFLCRRGARHAVQSRGRSARLGA
jgi:rhodanese-related sulfurtransferase